MAGLVLGLFLVFPTGWHPRFMNVVMQPAVWLFTRWQDLGFGPHGDAALLGPAFVFVASCTLLGSLIGALSRRRSVPMTLAVILACGFVGALSSGCRENPAKSGDVPLAGFPVLPPIANADPSSRSGILVKVPARLTLLRGADSLSITEDPASTRDIPVTVGAHMVIGYQYQLFVYPYGATRPVEPSVSGVQQGPDFSLHGTRTLNTRDGGIPQSGVHYTVDLALQMFETDLPPQHFWAPQTGKFTVLWEGTLQGHVPALPP